LGLLLLLPFRNNSNLRLRQSEDKRARGRRQPRFAIISCRIQSSLNRPETLPSLHRKQCCRIDEEHVAWRKLDNNMFVKTAQEKKSLFIHCATFVLYVRGQRKLSRAGERRNSKELLLCQLGAEEKREKEQVAKNVLGVCSDASLGCRCRCHYNSWTCSNASLSGADADFFVENMKPNRPLLLNFCQRFQTYFCGQNVAAAAAAAAAFEENLINGRVCCTAIVEFAVVELAANMDGFRSAGSVQSVAVSKTIEPTATE
jgi:hypothetical protein